MKARKDETGPRDGILSVLCRRVDAARAAVDAILRGGVEIDELSVLARGPGVDKNLVHADEMNANLPVGEPPGEQSALSRKLSEERRFLLDGCWAVGPEFRAVGRRSGLGDRRALAHTLPELGLDPREGAEIEIALKKAGGVWLCFRGDPDRLAELEAGLHGLEGVVVKVLSLS